MGRPIIASANPAYPCGASGGRKITLLLSAIPQKSFNTKLRYRAGLHYLATGRWGRLVRWGPTYTFNSTLCRKSLT